MSAGSHRVIEVPDGVKSAGEPGDTDDSLHRAVGDDDSQPIVCLFQAIVHADQCSEAGRVHERHTCEIEDRVAILGQARLDRVRSGNVDLTGWLNNQPAVSLLGCDFHIQRQILQADGQAQTTIARVNNSNADLRFSTVTPCDIRASSIVENLVVAAVDTKTMELDRLSDLQTALFEAYVDLVESVVADAVQIIVNRTSTAITVRLAAISPDWTTEPSFLLKRVLATLADRTETGDGTIEFEFLVA